MAGLRHLLAAPLLMAHRMARMVSRRPTGTRLLLLHDVPPAEMAALDRLCDALTLASPADYGNGNGRDQAILTFDDGFASNLDAAKVLERRGARGLFFVCPGLIDLPWGQQRTAIAANVFDGKRRPEDIPERMRLMTWDEIRGLAARGHVIASHTMTHRRLTLLSEAEIEAEIDGSAQRLKQELGAIPQWFAFPFGDVDSVNAATLRLAGKYHTYCRSGVRGGNTADTPNLAVLADHVDLAAPFAYQMLAAEGGLDSRYAVTRNRLGQMIPR